MKNNLIISWEFRGSSVDMYPGILDNNFLHLPLLYKFSLGSFCQMKRNIYSISILAELQPRTNVDDEGDAG